MVYVGGWVGVFDMVLYVLHIYCICFVYMVVLFCEGIFYKEVKESYCCILLPPVMYVGWSRGITNAYSKD